jgi:hypothetical protein
MNVAFDKPEYGWIELMMGEQGFVLSSAPCRRVT